MPSAKSAVWWAGWLLLFVSQRVAADPPRTPFVAGFERFGRHEEISSRTAGLLLTSELNCIACHASNAAHLSPKLGPDLTGAGNRIRPEWIERFLASPQKEKPGTTMPQLFTDWPRENKETIAALAAFLSTQREEFPVLKASGALAVPFEFWNKGNIENGKELYHQVGCVACHEPDGTYEPAGVKPSPLDQLIEQLSPEELEEMGLSGKARRVESIPHSDLAAKYTRRSLSFFLLDPDQTRPSGRMPNMKLSPMEAADLASYLLRDQTRDTEISEARAEADLIAKGKELFSELRCINCHRVKGIEEEQPAKPWHQLSLKAEAGCLSNPNKDIPSYPLDEAQVAALSTAVAQGEEVRDPPAETRLEHWLLKYNCLACHERGKLGGVGRFRKPYFETVGHVDIGDEGRLPPPLDGVGAKLTRDHLKNVLTGKADLRPFLKARMPKYSKFAVPLAGIFAETDAAGLQVPDDVKVFGDLSGLADTGRTLVDQGCVECHSFRGESLPGVVGMDLAGATDRLQPKWFHEFLTNPAAKKPKTRMPTFFPGGESQNKKILNGDTDRQIAAMWAYLKELDKQKLPEKIEQARSKDYELKPAKKPIVLRTFMKEAGTHAIAVGFPDGVHFAFDAEVCRPAIAWRGKFLDAQGTWFSRFTPPADPLGDDGISLPAGLPLAVLKSESETWPKSDSIDPAYRYLGYRLDNAGVPTFLYRYESFEIEDRLEPTGEGQLKRQLTIRSKKPETMELWFQPLAGKSLKANTNSSHTDESGLTAKVAKPLGESGQVRREGAKSEWMIPIKIKAKTTIEVEYEW